MARFTDELRAAADPIWRAQHEHPFVRGIGDGSLPRERFRHFLRQDLLYLGAYARALALAAARAPAPEAGARFAALARGILEAEGSFHRHYGGDPAELARERMTPTTRGYTDFLLATASLGLYAELVAALLPCSWGYSEVGRALAAAGAPADEEYAAWIALYAADDFAADAEWLRDATDEAAEREPGARERMREAFLWSSWYELSFWDAAWREERAPEGLATTP